MGSDSQEDEAEFDQAETEQEEHTRSNTFQQAEYGKVK